jgi:hypothetical protein
MPCNRDIFTYVSGYIIVDVMVVAIIVINAMI